jgi:hypothetical protein
LTGLAQSAWLLTPQGLFWPPAGRKKTFILVGLAAKPPNQPKKMVISLLPQPVLSLSKGRKMPSAGRPRNSWHCHDLRGRPASRPESPAAAWKNRSNSFDFAALPQNQTKKIVPSMLPQPVLSLSKGRKSHCGVSKTRRLRKSCHLFN